MCEHKIKLIEDKVESQVVLSSNLAKYSEFGENFQNLLDLN